MSEMRPGERVRKAADNMGTIVEYEVTSPQAAVRRNASGLKKNRKGIIKLCVKCDRTLPVNEFYKNTKWSEQSFHDAWCKKCASEFCKDKETLRQYCWYNNRVWSDQIYKQAEAKAKYMMATNEEYLTAKTEKKKEEVALAITCRAFFSFMNLKGAYEYSNNIGQDAVFQAFDPNSEKGTAEKHDGEMLIDEGKKLFSAEWNGMYTQNELDYLNRYFSRLEKEFVLDNHNILDYARKVAKASLNADIMYEKARGYSGYLKDYKTALDVFDNLCKSAAFAECKRKASDAGGMGSLGEIIASIESTGIIQTVEVTFPEDDVDKIIADFRHFADAIGIGGDG